MKRPDHDKPDSLNRVRGMRRNPTEPEKRLWNHLRNRQLAGLKFRRQAWIGHSIVDFVTLDAGLIVEVDGDSHATTDTADADRTKSLEREGFRVLRVANADVMANIEGVLQTIMNAASNRPSPSHSAMPSGPLPLPQGERKP